MPNNAWAKCIVVKGRYLGHSVIYMKTEYKKKILHLINIFKF